MEKCFQALSESTRLRMVRLLALTGEEACLCEFVASLQEPKYKLSRHLKILRNAGLLSAEKEGRWVYHRLVKEPDYLRGLISTIKHLPDPQEVYANDLARFQNQLTYRKNGRCRVGNQATTLDSNVA